MSRAPHTLRTSSRARTCHCGCIASRTVVHVSKFEVVCFPAKKKLLHSSTMSWAVMALENDDVLGHDFDACIISPNKSLGQFFSLFLLLLEPLSSSLFLSSLLRSINFIKDFFISLSSFQDFLFLSVGRNLQQINKKNYILLLLLYTTMAICVCLYV